MTLTLIAVVMTLEVVAAKTTSLTSQDVRVVAHSEEDKSDESDDEMMVVEDEDRLDAGTIV